VAPDERSGLLDRAAPGTPGDPAPADAPPYGALMRLLASRLVSLARRRLGSGS
jgi:hypothetical protein